MQKIVYSDFIYSSQKVKPQFDKFRIVVISDMHSVEFEDNNEELIDKIRRVSPDIIIAAGDMVSSHGRNMNIIADLFAKLINICPVYYGPGNHECYLNMNPKTHYKFRKYIKYIRSIGVKYLVNRSAKISVGGEMIRISAINTEDYYNKVWNKKVMPDDYLSSRLKPCKDNRLEILIAHNPDYFENYANWGADIVFSGHVHGGIIILPYLGGVINPSWRLFPYYDYGVFTHNSSRLYLTRGLGAHTIPLRLFNPPEIMVITLEA